MASEIKAKMDFSILRYSAVWEDINLLYAGLDIQPDDDVLSVTSAGDNVLGLLLQNPNSVTAIDVSPAQNALLELKMAAISELTHPEFLSLLGIRNNHNRLELFNRIKPKLNPETQQFWEQNSGMIERGILMEGKLEKFFKVYQEEHLPKIHPERIVQQLLSQPDLVSQHKFFDEVWNTTIFEQSFKAYFGQENMSKTGRDPAQFAYVEEDAGTYFYKRFCNVCRTLPLQGNFYVELFLTGEFKNLSRVNPYLLEENYEKLRQMLPKIKIETSDLESFLAQQPAGSFSKANLSNIFEYMSEPGAETLLQALHRTFRKKGILAYWNLMVPRHRPNSMEHQLKPLSEESKQLWEQDRSWFYRGFVLEQVL